MATERTGGPVPCDRLRGSGVKIVPDASRSSLWKKAAPIKAGHLLQLVGAFAAATAVLYDGT